jgi:prevent-host-death family protein
MTSLPISKARGNLSELGNRVALRGERIVIERRGKDLFALVPVEDLEMLERLEDEIDLETVRRRLGEPSQSLQQVKRDLGL